MLDTVKHAFENGVVVYSNTQTGFAYIFRNGKRVDKIDISTMTIGEYTQMLLNVENAMNP